MLKHCKTSEEELLVLVESTYHCYLPNLEGFSTNFLPVFLSSFLSFLREVHIITFQEGLQKLPCR